MPTLTYASKATISGVPAVGSVLKANPGRWVGAAPFFYTYYWTNRELALELDQLIAD